MNMALDENVKMNMIIVFNSVFIKCNFKMMPFGNEYDASWKRI